MADLYDRLVRTRAAQDSLEALLAHLIARRGQARARVRDAKAEYEDRVHSSARSHTFPEYTSTREREASWDLDAFNEKLAVRREQRVLDEAEMAFEFVKLLHTGIDSTRRDLNALVYALSVEGRLEH